jgi:hypothetical protein
MREGSPEVILKVSFFTSQLPEGNVIPAVAGIADINRHHQQAKTPPNSSRSSHSFGERRALQALYRGAAVMLQPSTVAAFGADPSLLLRSTNAKDCPKGAFR